MSSSDKLIIIEKHRNKDFTVKINNYINEKNIKNNAELLNDYKIKLFQYDARKTNELLLEIKEH